MNKIKNVSVLYDNKERQFIKAYATVNGKSVMFDNHEEIHELLEAYKKQENVSAIKNLKGRKKVKSQLVYDYQEAKRGNYIKDSKIVDWEKDQDDKYRIAAAKINRNSPFTGKKIANIWRKPAVKIASIGMAVTITFTSLVACAMSKKVEAAGFKNMKYVVTVDFSEAEPENFEKVNPNTWEEYLEYEDSVQKQFLVEEVMNKNMENSVKTLSVDGEDILTAIPAEQIAAGLIYYGGPLYTNQELTSIVGEYDLSTKIIPDVYNYIKAMGLNVIYAKDINELYVPVVGDPIADEANKKIFTLLYEAIHTSNANERNAKIKELNTAMEEYHINGDTKLNLLENPAADIHLEVANEVFTYYFDENSSKHYFGVAANYDVEQVGTTPEINGRNDEACSVLDQKLLSLQEYIRTLDKEELEELTKSTYELSYMYELMNDYIQNKYDIENMYAFDDVYKAMIEKTSSTDPRGEFDPINNPAGGKKGDEYRKTETGVTLKESELTAEQKAEAQAKAGIASTDNVNVEEKKKELELQYEEVYNATFNHFAGENVLGSSASYTDSWSSEYSGAWSAGKADGLAYKENKEKEGTVDNTIDTSDIIQDSLTTDDSNVFDPGDYGEYAGDTSKNPNQPNENTTTDTTDEVESTTNTNNEAGSTTNTYDEIEDGYTGEVTTDGTDVFDPSAYETTTQSLDDELYDMSDIELEALFISAGLLEEAPEETVDTQYTL